MSSVLWDVFWCTAIAKWTSCESSILADCNTSNTPLLSKERHVESWCVNEIWSWGLCHSDQFSNDALKVIFWCQSHFCQKSHSTKGYNPWFFTILGQNSTYSKMDIIWKLYSCWSQRCKSHLHISFLAWDTYHNSYPMYPVYMNGDTDCANEALFILNSTAHNLPLHISL